MSLWSARPASLMRPPALLDGGCHAPLVAAGSSVDGSAVEVKPVVKDVFDKKDLINQHYYAIASEMAMSGP